MAKFIVQGYIRSVRYLDDSCLVFLDEFRKGYRKPDGVVVDDRYVQWKVVFKGYFKNYISKHFSDGMLVDVYADVLPYAIEHDSIIDGYSCLGKTIDIAGFPRASVRAEQKLIRDSETHGEGVPDLDGYNRPDF